MLMALFTLAIGFCWAAAASAEAKPLDTYIAARIGEFNKIPAERQKVLAKVTAYLQAQYDSNEVARLTFICTHNSRRSQMCQVWAAVAASHYKIPKVETFSGGTEATAFNPRAIAALERAGVTIKRHSGTEKNPKYVVSIGANSVICFSKVYNEAPNPEQGFTAVMTCSEADKKCPTVAGAKERIALPYEDPKVSDGTATESSTYDERCAQIAREMLVVFSSVRQGG
jgi:arsenate reductase (thioredoxin)